MSPKRRVALMTGIFAAVGIGVSVAIIAAGGGFTADGPSIIDPPKEEDIWEVGTNLEDRSALEYSLTARGPSSSLESATLSMIFEEAGDNWDVKFTIVNGTAQPVDQTVVMSKQLTKEGQLDENFQTYFEPIQTSIFAVRDMAYGGTDKYLVVGAPWDTIFVGSSSVTVRVTGMETIQTQAGSFQAFVLSYKLDEQTSRIWMVSYMPLPVKAEVYDADDILQYKFELEKVSGIPSADGAL